MSKNDLETLKNKALTESALTFTKWPSLRLGMTSRVSFGPPDPLSGYEVRTDGEVLENGDLVLRYYAPNGREMYATVGIFNRSCRVEMTKREDGVFEGTMPYDPNFAGFQFVHYYLDGTEVINNRMVVAGVWGYQFANYVELPDPETPYIQLNNVPHGSLTREVYYSETVNEWLRCMVYTPPGYHQGGEYPVLYLQDGAQGSELTWMNCMKVPYIMDNLLAAGACEPFIVVTNDPMIQMPYEKQYVDNFDGFEGALLNDCIPFIESRYRVKADKWNRALAGFSLGSMQTSCIGISHPETFGWIGLLSGYLRRRDSHPTYEENPYLENLKQPGFLDENYRLFYRTMDELDRNVNEFLEDDEFCAACGADQAKCYVRTLIPNCIHDVNAMRRAFYDFAQRLFH